MHASLVTNVAQQVGVAPESLLKKIAGQLDTADPQLGVYDAGTGGIEGTFSIDTDGSDSPE